MSRRKQPRRKQVRCPIPTWFPLYLEANDMAENLDELSPEALRALRDVSNRALHAMFSKVSDDPNVKGHAYTLWYWVRLTGDRLHALEPGARVYDLEKYRRSRNSELAEVFR